MSSSEKLKVLLRNKEILFQSKTKKIKNKIKIINVISISITTILILSIMASTLILAPTVISILSVISASLIGIDSKFKFQKKTFEKKEFIDKLNKIPIKLEYINSCNGNLTEEEYNKIFEEFNTVL